MGLVGVETVSPSKPAPERSHRAGQPGGTSTQPDTGDLWAKLMAKANLSKALKRVERNGGAPGPDGMTTAELRPWLHQHWPQLRQALDDGTYRPHPVRRATIPKPDGGQRELGVPTVVDRLICQAIAQVLVPIFDPAFAGHSFGFRPARSAHQAVNAARGLIHNGYGWVVDVDLDRFFDRVGHDVLMARLARKVADRKVLRLIRRYLVAGIMVDGVTQPSAEGTPQGSPLSPMLANVMLDDVDRELEGRGHRFVRYADDLRAFVRSERAAQRVLDSVSRFVEGQLKLKVNRTKSKVTEASEATLLGFGFWFRDGQTRIRVAKAALGRFKQRLRNLTRRNWGISMQERIGRINRFATGWMAYFGISEMPTACNDLDKWLRRRLRQVSWKQWKRGRTRYRELCRLGVKPWAARITAYGSKGSWRMAASPSMQWAQPTSFWTEQGLRTRTDAWRQFAYKRAG